ncbi:MAG: GFA family protein [Candidatus Scalindua sp.]
MKREFGEAYASTTDVGFTAKYRATCFCNAVEYEVGADPVDAKICHCLGCQKLYTSQNSFRIKSKNCFARV